MFPAKLVKTKLLKRTWLSPSCVELTLSLSDPVRFSPGQYLNLQLGQFRAYSVTWQAKDCLAVKLCVDTSSQGIGAQFAVSAPLGKITPALLPLGKFLLSGKNLPSLFIATGVGIAPFRFMLAALQTAQPVSLIWGLRSSKDLFWHDFWQDLNNYFPNFSYQLCLSREPSSSHFTGRVTDWLRNQTDLTGYQAYICGNAMMVEAVKQELKTKGIYSDNIYIEKLN